MLCGWTEGLCFQLEIRKLSPIFWLNVFSCHGDITSKQPQFGGDHDWSILWCPVWCHNHTTSLATNHVIGGDHYHDVIYNVFGQTHRLLLRMMSQLHNLHKTTGCSVVTTPYSFTTLGWLNCPMMAASCRNLTLSSSFTPGFRVLTATGTSPSGDHHTPLSTVPNWPEPRWSTTLHREHGLMWNKQSMTV